MDPQTELFLPVPEPASSAARAGDDVGRADVRFTPSAPDAPHAERMPASTRADVFPAPPASSLPAEQRIAILHALLALTAPVRAGGKAAGWLKRHRVFKKTWDAQGLRVVENYRRASEALQARYPLADLQACGLFNKEGHLRFYRHSLLVPWWEGGGAVYLEALAPEADAAPPRLTTTGPAPCPYNAALLDGAPGRLYLCAGSLQALKVMEAGFPAVGLPDAGEGGKDPGQIIFNKSWLPRFRSKSVYVAFDSDAAGEAAAARVIAQLAAGGVEAYRLAAPAGKDIVTRMTGP